MAEEEKPLDSQIEQPPGSLANTIEEVIFPQVSTPNSLGTVAPYTSIELKVDRGDGKRAIFRWDPAKGSRLRVREVKSVVTQHEGKKFLRKGKIVSWENVGNVSEYVVGRTIRGIMKSEDK